MSDESQLFKALDELCVEMSEITGQPWGYNKELWEKALKSSSQAFVAPVCGFCGLPADHQHPKRLAEALRERFEALIKDNVVQADKGTVLSVGGGVLSLNGMPIAQLPEPKEGQDSWGIYDRHGNHVGTIPIGQPERVVDIWTCIRHPHGLEVHDIPVNEKCPVCQYGRPKEDV